MGLTTGNFPPVDPATFMEKPYRERTKTLARHWVEYGFGAPKITAVIYILKLLSLYVVGLFHPSNSRQQDNITAQPAAAQCSIQIGDKRRLVQREQGLERFFVRRGVLRCYILPCGTFSRLTPR